MSKGNKTFEMEQLSWATPPCGEGEAIELMNVAEKELRMRFTKKYGNGTFLVSRNTVPEGNLFMGFLDVRYTNAPREVADKINWR